MGNTSTIKIPIGKEVLTVAMTERVDFLNTSG